MDEEAQLYIDAVEEKMEASVHHLEIELQKVRAGKASPDILNGIRVSYYGNETPLTQVANVSTPDSRSITIQPWEKNMIEPIERAIMASNIGLTPANNGELIRLNLPLLTEERRRDLVKQVKNLGEHAKIAIRNARKEGNDDIKKLQKDGLAEDLAKDAEDLIQKLTDQFTKKVDDMLDKKEKDILTI